MSAPASASNLPMPQPGGAIDHDALRVGFMARADALPATQAKIAEANALLADIVASGLDPAAFKDMAGRIGKGAGLDPAVLLKQMNDGRAAMLGGAAASVAGARPPSGMQNPDPASSPEPLAAVLDMIVRAVNRQVVCSPYIAIAVALWAAGTYGAQRASIFPRLAFISATKRCGKSLMLALLRAIVSMPVKADSVSASALFRLAEARKPTLLIDEADTFVTGNEDLRGVLNAGYEWTGSVMRSVPTPDC